MGESTTRPTVDAVSENLASTTLHEAQRAPAAPSASAALPIRNANVSGLFEDEQAAYRGPRLSKRGQSSAVQETGEKLDLIFRNSESGAGSWQRSAHAFWHMTAWPARYAIVLRNFADPQRTTRRPTPTA